MKNFWQSLPKPFFALAPMDDVTDTVFREIVARAAAPHVAFTEFANTDGFLHPSGHNSTARKLWVNKSEQALGVPLVAQIWGQNPDHFFQTARRLAATRLYAGIDINMGCPEKKIVKRGSCGGLIENPSLAAKIIQATKEGAGELPVSVKTRLGLKNITTQEWCSHLLNQGLAALTIHGRTVREMSKVPAHWDEIGTVVHMRNQLAPQTMIIGNGDVLSLAEGGELARYHGVDGVMIGRGIFHNLFTFSQTQSQPTLDDMKQILLSHLELYEQTWGDKKTYDPLKKYFKIYISGFSGAAELRHKLMSTSNSFEARKIIEKAPALV